ncbi:MAG: 2-oxoglutarate dehydrogenase complex dihydrolipoyllysine-residue succinyltransferase [Gammaproteobacteria bacterium]|nr:MAG: 2-oxoglutarate dehydrogenase complex dihydrolipoyllysine-residue succinyltransferase [Gammaproteobacteria bacterium]
MTTEIRVPQLPESVADATLVAWHKQPGDPIRRDENLADLETDKVVLEVPAPANGVVREIRVPSGAVVTSGQVLALIEEGGVAAPKASDVVGFLGKQSAQAPPGSAGAATPAAAGPAPVARAPTARTPAVAGARAEQRVPMTRLRARIAQRLIEAQSTQALLTTFNEVDLSATQELRARYKERFEKDHGVKLGFMSFFVKASIEALKKFPVVNASVDGNDIVYHEYYDIGVAVSTDRGLVVPVVRDADTKSFAVLEKEVADYARKAREGSLAIEDLTGGTFTITNGGVFGSLMSTPIVNAPQSAILGMHKIQERPMVVGGAIAVRPMMYLAVSYDHRIIDGREAVQFLVGIKEALEDPGRMLLGI